MGGHPPALRRGHRVGKYEVLGRLSSGGMAELYLAFLRGQGGFRKFVALKRVLPNVAADQEFVTMFLDEARITAALTHPNIAQVFELVESQTGELVLALEFIAGQNVQQILARADERNVELSPGFCCRLARDLLLGLHFAHSFVEPLTGVATPVVHRDVNPRNVMVSFTGATKVVDFGIAKAKGRLGRTETGVLKGTLFYMSPEQARLKKIDGRSDVFSAAHVLYELLARRSLFPDVTDSELIGLVASVKAPSLREVAPHLPGDLCEVVMKGLAAKPEGRWQTAREFARALEETVRLDDEGEVAAVMAQLFDDKIAVTRVLLQSSGEVSAAKLAEFGGELEVALAAPGGTVAHRPRLADAPLAPTVSERPEKSAEPGERPGPVPIAAQMTRPSRPRPELSPTVLQPALRPRTSMAPWRLFGLVSLISFGCLAALWALFR